MNGLKYHRCETCTAKWQFKKLEQTVAPTVNVYLVLICLISKANLPIKTINHNQSIYKIPHVCKTRCYWLHSDNQESYQNHEWATCCITPNNTRDIKARQTCLWHQAYAFLLHLIPLPNGCTDNLTLTTSKGSIIYQKVRTLSLTTKKHSDKINVCLILPLPLAPVKLWLHRPPGSPWTNLMRLVQRERQTALSLRKPMIPLFIDDHLTNINRAWRTIQNAEVVKYWVLLRTEYK